MMMTEQEHYSLRWNNHQNHILRAFDALLQTKTLVDVTLVCAETSIRAHKVVLSACSPFFQNVFAENPCKHPVIVLKDFPGWVVQAIVDFMYRGEISVPQERLQILIQAGESLQIRGLVDHSITENVNGIPLTVDLSRIDGDSDDFIATAGALRSPTNTVEHHQQQHSHTSKYDETLLELKRTQQHLLRPNERDHQRTTPAAAAAAVVAAAAAAAHQIDNNNRELNCTSPMPRRKQARPRRRSGECGPHDSNETNQTNELKESLITTGGDISTADDKVLKLADTTADEKPMVQKLLGSGWNCPELAGSGWNCLQKQVDTTCDDDDEIIDHDEFDDEDDEVSLMSTLKKKSC